MVLVTFELAGEHCGNHFLSSSFATTTGDADKDDSTKAQSVNGSYPNDTLPGSRSQLPPPCVGANMGKPKSSKPAQHASAKSRYLR